MAFAGGGGAGVVGAGSERNSTLGCEMLSCRRAAAKTAPATARRATTPTPRRIRRLLRGCGACGDMRRRVAQRPVRFAVPYAAARGAPEGQRRGPGLQPGLRRSTRCIASLLGQSLPARRVRGDLRRRRLHRRHGRAARGARRRAPQRHVDPHPELGLARAPAQRRDRRGARRLRPLRRQRRLARRRGARAAARRRRPRRRRHRPGQGRRPQALGLARALPAQPLARARCSTTRSSRCSRRTSSSAAPSCRSTGCASPRAAGASRTTCSSCPPTSRPARSRSWPTTRSTTGSRTRTAATPRCSR